MADASRLKKKAAEFEAKRQHDRALAVYEQILDEIAGEEQEADIPLYNRAGDLYLRTGNLERAVTLYEKAVDLYAEGGFFNNAIALCNKILRHAPNRASVYYKLGKISAQKGFNSDAKQNFLEYAGRMQKIGRMDEAFHALKEFADLCPSQDDVRLMLAEQLTRAGRKTEAFEQLQILHEQLDAEGRKDEAAATVDRLKALNPTAEPRRATGGTRRRANDLVFLDVNADPGEESAPESALESASESAPLAGLEPTSLVEEKPAKRDRPLTPLEFAAIPLPPPADEAREREAAARALADLPVMDAGDSADDDWFADSPDTGTDVDVAPPLDLEPTSLVEVPPPAPGDEPGPPPPATMDEPESATPALMVPQAPAVDLSPDFMPTAEPSPAPAAAPAAGSDDDFLDLGDWLRAEEGPKTTRMVAEGVVPPPIDEQADFGEMLQRFKEGVAANIDEDDSAAHYDLGIAFKEMGLVEEAIGEFQKALRGTTQNKAPTYEALGTCFVEKKQYEVATTILQRALNEPGNDDNLAGVLYLLGNAAEALGKTQEAASYYQRVLAVDIGFRDVSERLAAVTQAAK